MATLNEIAYNILNIARSGISSDDDTLSINQIKHWIHYYRGALLQKYTSNGRKIHPNCLQVWIAPVINAECDQGRIDQVPDVMSFSGQRAIERIETCHPNGWEFPSTVTKTQSEEIKLYVYYDMTSLKLPDVKQAYNGVVDWINQQKYYIDNPQLGIEGHKVEIAYHTACTSERWLDWATVSLTGRFNNACASGGDGTGKCGGNDMSESSGSITGTGTESGNLGGYPGVTASSVTINCDDTGAFPGGGIGDAIEWDRNGYGPVWRVQDWVQNSNNHILNNPANSQSNGYTGSQGYNEPPKKAIYYNGGDSYELASGQNERIIIGGNTTDGVARVFENISNQWVQIGSDITGATEEHLGMSVDISKDGNIIAVGCPETSSGSGDKGIVRVYEYDDTISDWSQLGSDITGQVDNDDFGNSIALSYDGYRIAISAPEHDTNGTIQVYDYDPNASVPAWTQMGSDLDGDSSYTKAGGDGYNNTLAFGGFDLNAIKWGDTICIGYPTATNGAVKIFKWNGASWIQTATIDGENSGDKFGFSVAMNKTADHVVIGAPGHAGEGTDKGATYVYNLQTTGWAKKPGTTNPVFGESNSSESGCSVDIDETGEFIISGAKLNAGGGTNRGSARVYAYDAANGYEQRGSDIDGTANGDKSFAVSMSDDGVIVALGSDINAGWGTNGGRTDVYAWNAGGWSAVGGAILGATTSKLGYNLSLSNRSNKDTIIFYDTEPGTWASNYSTHTSPALTDSVAHGWQQYTPSGLTNFDNRRLGNTAEGFGPPPAASADDNVVVLIFADEASDANHGAASPYGGPYHTNWRPGGNHPVTSGPGAHWLPTSPSLPNGQPAVLDGVAAKPGSGSSITATYTSTSVNVWRFATDNGNAEQSSHDISSYTSANTALTGAFSSATIADVHPSACWKADWIFHIETLASHNKLFRAFLYPTRQSDPGAQIQYNIPFALHAAGAISSGNQSTLDGTYTHDGTTGTVPYSEVVDLSPLYYINPYYTSGYGALDQYGWSLNYEMGVFNGQKLQTDLDDLLNTVTWTEVIIPDNSAIELCDCHEHIPTNKDRLRFQQFNRFTPGRAINGERLFRWYIEPQGFRYHNRISIILPDWDSDLSLAKVWAVFSNPENIEGYDADFEYPFPDELLPALILEVLQKELNMTLTTPVDMLNDGSGIVATKPVKESKGKSKK
tara:strand:+ start:31209 stop:34763 length:3555 start_codon:yes stop_codon:yes gene_type:complete